MSGDRMEMTVKRYKFGIVGTFLGCLAIIAAVLPTWVLPLFAPPPPVDRVVVETAQKIKDRVIAKAKGVEYQEPKRALDWYQIFSAIAVILGVLALILSVVSFAFREPWRYSGTAGALGAGAIVFQFSLLISGALIGIVLIFVVLNFLGMSL
jgi:hypothetical protein